MAASQFYSLKAELPKGTLDFNELKGKVVLIVRRLFSFQVS
jgi:hypothetical protein